MQLSLNIYPEKEQTWSTIHLFRIYWITWTLLFRCIPPRLCLSCILLLPSLLLAAAAVTATNAVVEVGSEQVGPTWQQSIMSWTAPVLSPLRQNTKLKIQNIALLKLSKTHLKYLFRQQLMMMMMQTWQERLDKIVGTLVRSFPSHYREPKGCVQHILRDQCLGPGLSKCRLTKWVLQSHKPRGTQQWTHTQHVLLHWPADPPPSCFPPSCLWSIRQCQCQVDTLNWNNLKWR